MLLDFLICKIDEAVSVKKGKNLSVFFAGTAMRA